MNAVIKIVKGKNPGASYYLVKGKRTIFGREESCDVHLPDVGVSRQHFAIDWNGRDFVIADLGSSNGTYVNSERVKSAPLKPDDLVVAGEAVLQFLSQDPIQKAGKASTITFVANDWKEQGGDRLKKLRASETNFIETILEAYAGEKLERLQRALATVYKVGNILSAEEDLEVALGQVMEAIAETFGPDHGGILLCEEDQSTIASKVVWSREPEQARAIVLSRTIVDQALKKGLSILTDDPLSDKRFAGAQSIVTHGIRSALCVPMEAHKRIIGALYLDIVRTQARFSERDMELLAAIAKMVGIAVERMQLVRDMKGLFFNSIRALVAAIEAKDAYTRGHSERVSAFATILARELALPDVDVDFIEIAGILHDVGKIGVPEEILKKQGRLTPEEYAIMKRHPVTSEAILKSFKNTEVILAGIRHHHERYDGTGYPDSLAGDKIPFPARILAVADAYDAMVTRRPYKASMTVEQAAAEIRRCTGTQFDPKIVEAFFRLFARGALPRAEERLDADPNAPTSQV